MAGSTLHVGRFGRHGDTTLLQRPWARSTRHRTAYASQGAELGGAAYLLWLAWKIANAGRVSDMRAPKLVGFFGAAVFQWINPKGWLIAVSAAGTYLQVVSDNVLTQAMVLGALFFAAALPSGLVWLSLGATVHVLLHDRSARMFNIAMAVALAASVVTMFR